MWMWPATASVKPGGSLPFQLAERGLQRRIQRWLLFLKPHTGRWLTSQAPFAGCIAANWSA